MLRLLGPLLLLAASVWGEPAHVVLPPAFTPNPLLVSVPRAEKVVIEVPEGVSHLVVQAAFGDLVGGEKSLSLEVKPGPVEVALTGSSATAKLRIFDADRPRILPDTVKTVRVGPRSPLTLSGELGGDPAIPDAQLEVTAELKDVKWELQGAANEVWLSTLALEDSEAVKAGPTLQPGRYAVWVRGTAGSYSVVAQHAGVGAEPTFAELANENDPRVKAFNKLKAKIQGCIDRHSDWPDAAKRCNAEKVTKAQAKLEAALRKAAR